MSTKLVILGSTGSIGTQALAVCRRLGFTVLALSAHGSDALLEAQAREFSPKFVVLTQREAYERLKIALADTPTKVLYGVEGLCEIAALPEAELVLNALVGVVGLRPTLVAIQAGKRIALANKETLVAGGALVKQAVEAHGVTLIPVDSEHTAIFQCIQGETTLQGMEPPVKNPIEKIFLTASGGPFLGKTREELRHVTVKEALNHPKWAMGAKLTVDSATLMNKGLELIECVWNFGVPAQRVEVVIHPEAIIHSAVEFADHSVMAQLSTPDMHLSIQYALTYPKRVENGVKPFSFFDCGAFTFRRPDTETFTCLQAAIDAITLGGLTPCAINGANEEAVAAFLAGKITFLEIGKAVAGALERFAHRGAYTLEEVLEMDSRARIYTRELLGL